MLKHLKNTYVTHSRYYHLGDVINIIQQIHHKSIDIPGFYSIFSNIKCCPCCGVNTGGMMKKIVGLLDTKLTFTTATPKTYDILTPKWVLAHAPTPYDDLPYAKAKNLPPKRNYVVCQFDARSRGEKIPGRNKIQKLINNQMINIGDKRLPCINKTDLGLLEKFRLIASAKSYIGIDSGLTHLALMTDTPIVLVHPKSWDAKKYYPKTDQIEYRVL